jgi:hypothetical protein
MFEEPQVTVTPIDSFDTRASRRRRANNEASGVLHQPVARPGDRAAPYRFQIRLIHFPRSQHRVNVLTLPQCAS